MRSSIFFARSFVLGAAGIALATGIRAQTPVLLMNQGDIVQGIGAIESFQEVSVNNFGDWIAQAGTNAANNANVFIRNGVVTLREGTLLANPENSNIASVNFINLNQLGNIGWTFGLAGSGVDTFTNSGLFFNGNLLIQESQESTAPRLSKGSIWKTFKGLRMNDNNQILIVCDVDDPAINGNETCLMMVEVDNEGDLLAETVVVLEGDNMPGAGTRRVDKVNAQLENMAINNHGDVFFIADMSGSGGDVYMYYNDIRIANEDGESPVPGANHKKLNNSKVDINDRGDYVYITELTVEPADAVIKNNELFVRENDVLPFFESRRIQSFVKGKLMLTQNGDVLYYVDMQGNIDTDTGIMLNEKLLVQENISMHTSGPIGRIAGFQDSYWLSKNGRWLIFRGELGSGEQAVFLLDLGEYLTLDGCSLTNEGTLELADGFPILGADLEFHVDNGQGVGVTPFLLATSESLGECGFNVAYGEWLIDLNSLVATMVGIPWGFGPVEFQATVPNDPALVDQDFFLQALFFDLGDASPAPKFRLTNGLKVVVGSP